jgi:hypothetical protein
VGFLGRLQGGLNEVVKFGLERVEHAERVLESFSFLPEAVGLFRIRVPNGLPIPRLDLAFDLEEEVFVEMWIKVLHLASFQTIPERKAPGFAVALNCAMGSSSLKAEVKAFEGLHSAR